MKLVRRARKSIRERRMKACINDLNANLSKVELRVFKKQKGDRERRRIALGGANPVPADVIQGKMSPELYDIECRLHKEAGLPMPPPYQGYKADVRRSRQLNHRLGLVDFEFILAAVRRVNRMS